MGIETTTLYQEMRRRAPDIPAGPRELLNEFERLRGILQEHGKYIVLLFPEYTPHDHTRHLDNLFALADRVLGTPLYMRLGPVELVILAFGLYAHDWGMAVSEAERHSLVTATSAHSFALLPDEPSSAQAFIHEANLAAISPEVAWRDYLRRTHGLRSGARLRKHLEHLGPVFAESVAKIAEGHTLSLRDVRDPDRYPLSISVFGETVNLPALATYVRMVDLLDIGEDRTPYALWKFVAPADAISSMEWRKHRALSPVSIKISPVTRQVLVSGHTDDPEVFAALADLRSWIDEQFAMSMTQLRTISGKYDLDLDSRIIWSIESSGFEPLTVRFELDRSRVLGLLSSELYKDDPLAFVRELLQNSVDAVDMREALLAKHGLELKGEIRIRICSSASGLSIEWSDNGLGMDEDVLSAYFARLGCSWYQSREANRLGQIEAISLFGVGILSCFAVSHKLTVETLRDPQVGRPRPGLVIEIPARESHFRIRTATTLPVGTTIRLEVPASLSSDISKESVCLAIYRIARYVRHRITVESDGVVTETGFLARRGRRGADGRTADDLKNMIFKMQGDSTEKLFATTTTVAFELGDPASDYHGHYSAIVPNRPTEVRESADSRKWFLEGERIDLRDVHVDNEPSLFVKGIQTGPVTKLFRYSRLDSKFPLARYTDWLRPRLLLNVRHPSYLEFNLARSTFHLKSRDMLEGVWREIAIKLRTSTFNWPITSAADTAVLLGSCALFGQVPDFGLDALVEKHESPLLIIRSGEGPMWSVLREVVHGEEFIEAPFELPYAFAKKESFEIGSCSGLEGWEGGDALFPSEGVASYRYPWLRTVLDFGYRALTQLGWFPVEIRMVRPPANETVPIVCRVWRNLGPGDHDDDQGEGKPGEERQRVESWNISKKHYIDQPEVLRFPASMTEFAAMGSRYWNIDHPKIAKIIAVLMELEEATIQGRLSGGISWMVLNLMSKSADDYHVPSLMSGVRRALEVPNRLIDVAEEQGLSHAEHLVPSDFVPGTIEGYQDPHNYDLRGWKIRGTGLGQRLD
jgi:hypothetical protein